MASSESLSFSFMIIFFLSGAMLPYLLNKKRTAALYTACLCSAGGSILGLWLSANGLFTNEVIDISYGYILPQVELHIVIDGLGQFFLFTISLISLVSSVFSMQYMKVYHDENIAWWGFCYNLFLLSMIFVVTVNNIITFLIFWELMSLSSYFLVTFSYKRELVRKAGFIYIVMTHIGTVFIATAFFLLAGSGGSLDFQSLTLSGSTLTENVRNIIFVCALIGFGTKAGLVPMHIWLPQAHPAAPTNISAIMSGVMLKTAIYGMMRLIIDILGVGPAWWGALIVVLGIISAVVGIISALMEHDLKRLLAYSSVENMGIITIGLGASMVLTAWSHYDYAALALAASLFHVFNHAVFKGLLFLSTGSIYYASHTKNIELLGGLIKRMPYTAGLFLTGALAISAIPPFSGFASEYQIYISLLNIAYQKVSIVWNVGAVLGCVALALTGALVAACFVKAFGISFLALPRSSKAAEATEVPVSMLLSISPLAVLCLLVGIFPQPFLSVLSEIYFRIVNLPGSTAPVRALTNSLTNTLTNFNYIGIMMVLGLVILLLLLLSKLFGSKVRRTETWGCGIELNHSMEYTASSFSQPVRRVYSSFTRPERKIDLKYNQRPYFNYHIIFQEHIRSGINSHIYKPMRSYAIKISRKWQFIQSGNVNLYLSYIFVTLIILLIFGR